MRKKSSKRKNQKRNQKPLNLVESREAKRLKKRLGKELKPRKPVSKGTVRSFLKQTIPFGFTERKLRGKRVLFVGVGSPKVISEAREKGINALGLEPRLSGSYDKLSEKMQRTIVPESIQEFTPKKRFDFVIASWSVPFYLRKAFDVRLSFFKMLSSLKVGGKAAVGPLKFGSSSLIGETASSLKRKIEAAGFKVEPIPLEKMRKRCKNANIELPIATGAIIKRTEKSDLRKLQELLSL